MLRLTFPCLVVVLGCHSSNATQASVTSPGQPTQTSGASAPQGGYVGEDARVERAVLQFETAEAAGEFDRLLACFTRDLPGFYAYPMRRIGNFVNIEWCKGSGAEINCAGGDTRTTPGAAWTSLETHAYESSWPQVFGLGFSVGEIPMQGIGASVSWSSGAKGVSGEHAHFTFFDVKGGVIETRFTLALVDAMKFGETVVEAKAVGTHAELVERIRRSPESLRTEIEARMTALERAVLASLDADEPRKCVYGEYRGDGIPPSCDKLVPLDDAEKAAARARVSKYTSGIRALASTQAPAMHAKVVELLPTTCWSPKS